MGISQIDCKYTGIIAHLKKGGYDKGENQREMSKKRHPP